MVWQGISKACICGCVQCMTPSRLLSPANTESIASMCPRSACTRSAWANIEYMLAHKCHLLAWTDPATATARRCHHHWDQVT